VAGARSNLHFGNRREISIAIGAGFVGPVEILIRIGDESDRIAPFLEAPSPLAGDPPPDIRREFGERVLTVPSLHRVLLNRALTDRLSRCNHVGFLIQGCLHRIFVCQFFSSNYLGV